MQQEERCNKCGKKLDVFDLQEDFLIHKKIGYGSVHDGDRVHLKLCCSCFDELVSQCAIDPIIEEGY